jgi:outer membrane receptor protein involved in Fe transport
VSSGGYGTKYERQMSNSLSASITKSRGRWTHKAGAEMRNLLSNYSDPEQCSAGLPGRSTGGNFTFEYLTATGDVAAQNSTNAQKGVNAAGILTGAGMWYVRQSTNMLAALGQRYYALYTQNDWRATSRLTLNLGLRWDLQPGPTSLDFTKDNPFGAKGIEAFVTTAGYGRNLWETRHADFRQRYPIEAIAAWSL